MTVVDNVVSAIDTFITTVTAYAASHQDGIIALFLLIGVIITFSGRTLLRPTVFLLGFIPTSASMTAFGIAFLADEQNAANTSKYTHWLQSVVVIIALILGLLVGIVMVRLLFRVATFLLCAAFGAVVVAVAYLILLQPSASRNTLLVWYAAMVLAAVVAALLSVSYPETAIILGTAFDGAALAVFSVARFLGHRPDLLSPQPTSGLPPSDHWWAVAYALATVILATFGALTQRRVAIADRIIAQYANVQPPSQSTSDDGATAAGQYPIGGGPSILIPLADDDTQPLTSTMATVPDVSVVARQQRKYSVLSTNHPSSRYLLLPSSEDASVTVIEPPSSPLYREQSNGGRSPTTEAMYGATDSHDAQYSVVHNLGAQPLSSGVQTFGNSGSVGKNESADQNSTKGPL